MQQRAMIAMALACRPKLLVADEPTTALDVTIQAQIIGLLRELQQQTGMSVLLITHNFGIVSGFADRVIVMFRGKIVEAGATREVLRNPQHPYTRALIDCIPQLGQKKERLTTIDYSKILDSR
jgi:ABC-type dipeptide/oligopeptide/nickel transport system ATPase component